MKRSVKRILSVIIAVAMVLSVLPGYSFGSYAKEVTEQTDIPEETQISSEAEEVTTEQITTEVVEESSEVSTEESAEQITEQSTEQVTEEVSEQSTEENTEAPVVTTEEVTTEEPSTEEITTEEVKPDKKDPDGSGKKPTKKVSEKDKTPEIPDNDQAKTEPAEMIPTFDHIYDGVDVSGVFSSCELLIGTGDPSVFTADTTVVSEYKGIYLTRYPDIEQTKSAYSYYYNKVSFIEANTVVRATDVEAEAPAEIPNEGHGEADLTGLNNGDDAFSNIDDIAVEDYSGCIALIDSGASSSNVVKSVSVIGDSVADDNGHGTKMANAIAEANPDARILSIKALDSSGSGTVQDVYTAIQYAINANVSIINLSMSSANIFESEILEQAVAEANGAGIKVVASAGNNGNDAFYYVPGNISGVITIGACDETGNRIDISNFGLCVDYYVTASSTSIASAKFSAVLINEGLENIADKDGIFTREYVESEKPEELAEEHTDTDASHTSTDASHTATDAEKVNTPTDAPAQDRDTNRDPDDYHKLFMRLVAAAPQDYPDKISINFDIDDAIPSRIAPPSYYSVDGGLYSNGTCTAFNWTVNSWDIVDKDYKESEFEFSQGDHAFCNEVTKESSVGSYGNTATLTYCAEYKDPYWVGYLAKNVSVNQPSWTSRTPQKVNIMVFLHRDTYEGKIGRFTLEKKVKVKNLKNQVSMEGVKYDITITSKGEKVATIEAEMGEKGTMKNTSTVSDKHHPKVEYVKIVPHKISEGKHQNYIEIKAKDGAEPLEKVKLEIKEKSVPVGSPLIKSTGTITDVLEFDGKWNHKYTVANYPKVMGDTAVQSSWGIIFVNKTTPSTRKYDLSGAVYAIFTDEKDAKSANESNYTSKKSYVRAITTDKQGNGYAQIKFAEDPTAYDSSKGKTYYIKEVKAPSAGGFLLDETVYSQFMHHPDYLYIRQEGKNYYDYSLVFNADYYKSHYANNATLQSFNTTEDIFEYFISHGMNAEHQASPYFNPKSYKQKAGKGGLSGKQLYLDYISSGIKAGIAGLSSDEIENVKNSSVYDCYQVVESTDDTIPYVCVKKTIAPGIEEYVKNNPNYSLDGITFNVTQGNRYVGKFVVNESGNVKEVYDASGNKVNDTKLDVSVFMTKKADNTFTNTLFTVTEDASTLKNKGYQTAEPVSDYVTSANDKDHPKLFAIEDTILRDPLTIQLKKTSDTGDASELAGAEFTVNFYAQDVSDGKKLDKTKAPTKTWVFATKYDAYTNSCILKFTKDYISGGSTEWLDGIGNSLNVPYGFITIQETKAPNGYNLVGPLIADLGNNKISSDKDGILTLAYRQSDGFLGSMGDISGTYEKVNEIRKEDQEIRADLDIIKVDDNGNSMPGVKFEVTHADSGQKVILVTDENGKVSTEYSYVSHKKDTNSGKAKTGTWFGDVSKADDKYGALPVGTYKVKELRCEANQGKQLEKFDDIKVTNNDNKKVFHLYDKKATKADGKVWNYENPVIKTVAKVVETDSKTFAQAGGDIDSTDQTVEDTVTYDRLRSDTEYTVLTELMVVDKDDNATLYTDKAGNTRRQIETFKTKADYEKSRYEITETQKIEINGVDPAGYEEEQKRFVVYQTLFLGNYPSLEELDKAIADKTYKTRYDEFREEDGMDFFPVEHKQADDEDQTVRPGDIHTTIKDSVSESRIAMARPETTSIDSCYYTGLTPGKEVTMIGTLQVREGSDWSKITYDPKNPEADHDGFVYSTENLGENKVYTLRDADGNPVTASKTFTPETTSGYVDLEFNYDSSLLKGKSVVAFEELMYNGVVIMVHASLLDEDETIHYPEVKTSTRNALIDASQITEDNKYGAKEVLASDGQSFIDTVHSINLIGNSTFRFKGTLVDSITGEVLKDATGKEITATKDFTTDDIQAIEVTESPDAYDYVTEDGILLDMAADHANYMYNGDIDVEFNGYDFSNLGAVTGTVFEEVYFVKDGKEILIGEHKDLTDEEQFVRFISIHTSAKDIRTDTRIVARNVEAIEQDEITYEGLIPGQTYSFTTTLVVSNDKSGVYKDGEELKVDGKPVVVEHSFKPTKPNGVEKVIVKLNTMAFASMDITFYEELKNSYGLTVAFHKDLKDKKQTLHIPEIGTKATVNGAKSIITNGKVIINDEVGIRNLVVENGAVATLEGILMDKTTGKALVINGDHVTAEKTYVIEDANGTENLEFHFSANGFEGEVVVFERLFINGVEVASEMDLENTDQTVTIESPPTKYTPPTKHTPDKPQREKPPKNQTPPDMPPTPPETPPGNTPPKTGMAVFFMIMGLMVSGAAGMFVFRKKSKETK